MINREPENFGSFKIVSCSKNTINLILSLCRSCINTEDNFSEFVHHHNCITEGNPAALKGLYTLPRMLCGNLYLCTSFFHLHFTMWVLQVCCKVFWEECSISFGTLQLPKAEFTILAASPDHLTRPLHEYLFQATKEDLNQIKHPFPSKLSQFLF